MTSDPTPRLHQFQSSHFNEKARWALDWKGIEHRRVTYLPGPHAPFIRRLSGETSTPVLQLGGEVIAGSAAILAALDERFPERPLLASEDGARRRALEIQDEFDREVGPAVRTALFSILMDEPAHLCRVFASAKPGPVRALYRATLPLAKPMMARAHETDDPEAVARAFDRTRRALDFVAKETEATGFLVGDRFGLADLGCAALLAPLVGPPHPDMARPQPVPESVQSFEARWAEHPGAKWVLTQYERHRPGSCAIV